MADTILDRVKRFASALGYRLVLTYDETPPTVSDGDERVAQMGSKGGLLVEYPPGYAPPAAGAASVVDQGAAAPAADGWPVKPVDAAGAAIDFATQTTLSDVLSKLGAGLGAALSSGGGAKVGIVDSVAVALAAGAAEIGSVLADLRVAGAAVSAGNPVHVDGGAGALFDVKDRATRLVGVVTGAANAALALDSTLTGGTAKAILRGAAKGASSAADATTTAEGDDHQAVDVQLYHGGTAKDPTQIRALTSSDVVSLPTAQLPNASASPIAGSVGVPVRAVLDVTPGKQIHAQPSAGIANAAGKLLFGFTNSTGATLYVERVHLSNTQQTAILGVLCQMNVQVGTGAITGGTTVTPASSPALVAGCHDVRNAIPSGITFNTGGALGGAVTTIESVRWTTDEVTPNGNGSLAELIFAMGRGLDIFNFANSPIVVPDGYSMGVVCDAAASNGTTLVDFNICLA